MNIEHNRRRVEALLPFVTGATGAVDQGLTVATTDAGIYPSNTATEVSTTNALLMTMKSYVDNIYH